MSKAEAVRPEDRTNLHLHARANAQEAVAAARRRAQAFDTQAALERKTNVALKLAKGQGRAREDTEEVTEDGTLKPLIDRMRQSFLRLRTRLILNFV